MISFNFVFIIFFVIFTQKKFNIAIRGNKSYINIYEISFNYMLWNRKLYKAFFRYFTNDMLLMVNNVDLVIPLI